MSGTTLRVLVFLPCLTRGGAERQGVLVARHLKERGHDVEVWGFPAPRGRSTLVQDLRDRGLRYEVMPAWPSLRWSDSRFGGILAPLVRSWRWPRGRRRLEADTPRRSFDVLVPFTFWPSLAACLLQERLQASRCFWNHRGGYDAAGIVYDRFLTERILRGRPRFVANSQAGARFLRDTFRVRPDDVAVVANAFEPDVPAPPMPAREGSRELSLLHVANFYPEKDYETLLAGLRLLKLEGTACRLHFCGEFLCERERSRFERRVRELDVEDRVAYHGAATREEVRRLLASSDVGLLSSRSEGQPNSVMEYMHAGLPVVGTRIPGIEELLGAAGAPWLFDVGDAQGFARLVGRLREDPALREEIGRTHRRRILENFAADRVLPRWAELVEGA